MNYVTRGPADVVYVDEPMTRKVVYNEVQRVSPPPRYHSPVDRYYKVEPQRGPYYRDERVINSRYRNNYYDNGYNHNYGTTRSLSSRRCCTAAIATLALLGLAGLAVGLYFGITAAQKSATASLPQNNVMNGYKGYYVNGVYVVPVTTNPGNTYLVIGQDMPCNPNNNNSAITPSPYYPNCNQITTAIVPSNWTTTTTPTPVLLSAGFTLHSNYWSITIIGLLMAAKTAASAWWPVGCRL